MMVEGLAVCAMTGKQAGDYVFFGYPEEKKGILSFH
jgi:hypothetical protein